jgi:RNA polymerase sigma factor (sigma-70 family)
LKGQTVTQATSTGQILDLFEKYYEELYCHLRRFTTPRETEQLCREAFNELVSDDSVEPALPTRDHLFKVSERILCERYRPLRRIAEAVRSLNSHDQWNSRKEHEKETRRAPVATRLLRKMEREMKQLPSDLRQALTLLVGQQVPAKEASLRMGVSEELIDKWATHGLRRLTQRMYSHGN